MIPESLHGLTPDEIKKRYPGYDPKDTVWDEYFKNKGMMTNAEFFTSNGPGSFYEGMQWDDRAGEWIEIESKS